MMAAECMPRSIYIGTVALLTAATVVSLLQKQGALEGGEGRAILRSYSDFLGLIGVTSLAQVMPQFTQYPPYFLYPLQPFFKSHIHILRVPR